MHPQRIREQLRDQTRLLIRWPWLLLVTKTAVTATLAWLLGRALPGELADYAYYAPLGVLLAMTPTVATSLRSSIQAVVAILLGLGVAWLVLFTGATGVLALFVALGVATLLSGIPALGPGQAYVPFAAAFLFLSGGDDPESYSLGFALQFSGGAALAVVTNLIIPPPLEVQSLQNRVETLREEVATVFDTLSTVFRDDASTTKDEGWGFLLDHASFQTHQAQDALRHARMNRRGNVRAGKDTRKHLAQEEQLVTALTQVLHETEQLLRPPSALTQHWEERSASDDEVNPILPDGVRDAVDEAASTIASLIRSGDIGAEDQEETRDRIRDALHEASEAMVSWDPATPPVKEWVYVVLHTLREVTDTLSPRPSE